MLVQLKGLLSADEAAEYHKLLDTAPFEDGKKTAHGNAKLRKNNLQLNPNEPIAQELTKRLSARLEASEAFHQVTWASKMQPPRFCKYLEGMAYGEHLDLPTMGGRGAAMMRTDISMTVFFTPLEEYEGGELVFHSDYGTKVLRGGPGDAVIYPSTTLHRVDPVTRGERLVAITWIESRVRDPANRKMLYDLQRSLIGLEKQHGKDPQSADDLLRVRNCLYQLTRRWVE